LSEHDRAHLAELGGVEWIIMTNSDHTRCGQKLAAETGAKLAAPAGERESWPYACDVWLSAGDTLVAGLQVLEMQGSKTPGELALLIEGHTLVTGDLVRAHRAGSLMILPDAKLADRAAAIESVQKLASIDGVEAVLVGDGWPVFRNGQARLRELAASL
jgi:glyoxylase-like metal-dependent hydrolase (beta-lactamase superfamily II)